MTRDAFMRILLVASSVLIIIGVILMCSMLGAFQTGSAIKVYLADGKTEAVEFTELALVPGDTKEYQIKLEGSPANGFDVKLSFAEEAGDTLKDYVYVKIIADSGVVYDCLLAEAFEDGGIVLPVNFKAGKNTDLTIIYHLPINVGNEVKNAEAIFALQFTPSEK